MWRNRFYIAAGSILVALCAVLLGSGHGLTLVNLPGLMLVLGGTFVASVIGHSLPAVLDLWRRVPRLLREIPKPDLTDRDTLLLVAGLYRRGDVRGAERAAQELRDDFLLQGARLALDPYNGAELARVMQWRMRHRQEQDAAEVRILRTMAGFAPAFGMLGTVLGLVSVLGDLGPGGIQHLGLAMGFGLLSTLYGLLAANLLLRPLALKLEDHSRRRLSQMGFLLEAVVMLYERQHPLLLSEYLDCGLTAPAAPAPTQVVPPLGTGKVRRLAIGRA
jgi:chemotaxis protein MotA